MESPALMVQFQPRVCMYLYAFVRTRVSAWISVWAPAQVRMYHGHAASTDLDG